MNKMFDEFYIEFKTSFDARSEKFSQWMSIHAAITKELTASNESKPSNERGLHNLWFVVDESELKTFVHYSCSLQDGYHNLKIMGDLCVFYDMDCFPSRNDYGVASVKYVQVNIPIRVRKLFAKIARMRFRHAIKHWNRKDNYDSSNLSCTKLTLSKEQLERLIRLHGQGRGKVKFRFPAWDEGRTRRHVKECLKICDKSFRQNPEREEHRRLRERLKRLRNIAINSTHSTSDTAVINLSKDSDGFYWVAQSPHGYRIMNGGVINHSRDPLNPDWSTHT